MFSLEGQFLTCGGVILGDPDQGVAHARLVVGQAGGWDAANHIITIRRLQLHRDPLQELIVQGVRAVKLQQGTGKELATIPSAAGFSQIH